MSKTIRRKTSNIPNYYLKDYVKVEGKYGLYWKKVDETPENIKIINSKFHSDSGDKYFMGNAPKHFRKALDRVKKAKEKAELKRLLNSNDYEDYIFILRKKDANYNWW